MSLPNVVAQARAIIACGCTRKPLYEKHVQSLSFLGGFLWSTTQRDCHSHGSFCCHLLQYSKYPWPPRWFIESLFYYIKHKSFSQLHKISTCISFQNIAWLSLYQPHCFH